MCSCLFLDIEFAGFEDSAETLLLEKSRKDKMIKVPHELFKLTTGDEKVPDSPFEGDWSLEKASGGCLCSGLTSSLANGTTPWQPGLPSPFDKGEFNKRVAFDEFKGGLPWAST